MSESEPNISVNAGIAAARKAYIFVAIGLCASYACSGMTTIAPDEVGLIQRLGRWVRNEQRVVVHPPGFLFAWPYPFDQVIRVSVKQEQSIELSQYWNDESNNDSVPKSAGTARQPLLTGDGNYLQARVIAKYRVHDPAAYISCASRTPDFVPHAIASALTTTVNQWSIDQALRLKKEDSPSVSRDETNIDSEVPFDLQTELLYATQAKLSLVNAGLEITAVEINGIGPPRDVLEAFAAVQSARVEQDSWLEEARGQRNDDVIAAEAMSEQIVAEAKGMLSRRMGQAAEELAAFEADLNALERIGEATTYARLRRETWEKLVSNCRRLYYVPAEAGRNMLRLSISPTEKKP